MLHELREIRGGRLAEVAVADIDRVIGRAFDHAHEDTGFIGGERFADFEARVLGAFRIWLTARPGDETLFAVLHEGVNRLLLSWALTGGRAAMAGLEQDPGCVNVVDFDVADGIIQRSLVRTVKRHAGRTVQTQPLRDRDGGAVRRLPPLPGAGAGLTGGFPSDRNRRPGPAAPASPSLSPGRPKPNGPTCKAGEAGPAVEDPCPRPLGGPKRTERSS